MKKLIVVSLIVALLAALVVAASPQPQTVSKTFVYVIKKDGTPIGEHKAFASVQSCSGGKVKVLNSYPTLVEKPDKWFYYWEKGTRTGWGAKGCATSHSMLSVGVLIGPGSLPNYRSTVTCTVKPPEVFSCTHTLRTE
jgi:hypothetical protein